MACDFGGEARLRPLYDAAVTAARMLETYAREINYVRLDDAGAAGDLRAAWARIARQIARVEQQLAALPPGPEVRGG